MSAGDIYNSNNISSTLSPRLLSLLHRHCQERGHHGNHAINWTVTSAGPTGGVWSTEVTGEEEEDTDFGAVMYITAVLVFYSLGIVVMIIKYLQTERREMEEEMALESYLQGIPSKLIEQERQAVNRVAIQAFHTLTSGAKRQNQVLVAGAQVQIVRESRAAAGKDPGLTHGVNTTLALSTTPDDSDSSQDGGGGDDDDHSPRLLHRERSKHLPRVSLVFRDNRSSERRKMHQGSVRSHSGRAGDDGLAPGQRSPHSRSRSSSPQVAAENGQAGGYLDLPADNSNVSDTSVTDTQADPGSSENTGQNPRPNDNRGNCRKTSRRGASAGVRFEDEEKPCVKKPVGKTRAKPKGSRSPRGGNLKTPSKGSPVSSQTIEKCRHRHDDPVDAPSEDAIRSAKAVAIESTDSTGKAPSGRHRHTASRPAGRKQENKRASKTHGDSVDCDNKSSDHNSSIMHSTDISQANAANRDSKPVNSTAGLKDGSSASPTKVTAAQNSSGSDHVVMIASRDEKVGAALPKRLLVSDV